MYTHTHKYVVCEFDCMAVCARRALCVWVCVWNFFTALSTFLTYNIYISFLQHSVRMGHFICNAYKMAQICWFLCVYRCSFRIKVITIKNSTFFFSCKMTMNFLGRWTTNAFVRPRVAHELQCWKISLKGLPDLGMQNNHILFCFAIFFRKYDI